MKEIRLFTFKAPNFSLFDKIWGIFFGPLSLCFLAGLLIDIAIRNQLFWLIGIAAFNFIVAFCVFSEAAIKIKLENNSLRYVKETKESHDPHDDATS